MNAQAPTSKTREAPHKIAPFRGTEELILLLRDFRVKNIAPNLLSSAVERNLSALFGLTEAQRNGGMKEFIRSVAQIDAALGLDVQLEGEGLIDQFRYRIYKRTYPFPNLKGKANQSELDKAFLEAKIRYFLGPSWDYEIYVRNESHITYRIYKKSERPETAQA